jgi:hypothetical protein
MGFYELIYFGSEQVAVSVVNMIMIICFLAG